jgi:hypothetical protein
MWGTKQVLIGFMVWRSISKSVFLAKCLVVHSVHPEYDKAELISREETQQVLLIELQYLPPCSY